MKGGRFSPPRKLFIFVSGIFNVFPEALKYPNEGGEQYLSKKKCRQ